MNMNTKKAVQTYMETHKRLYTFELYLQQKTKQN